MGLTEGKRTIVLYVPPGLDGVGGVQVQVVNLARELSSGDYPGVRTIVFASQGSFVDFSLSPEVSPILELRTWESNNESLPENSLLLMWAGFRTVACFKKSNPRVLMWSVAPNQPFAHFERAAHRVPLLKRVFRCGCRRTVRYLASNASLVCMDLQNVEAMQILAGSKLEAAYLPVGLPVIRNQFAESRSLQSTRNRLRISWVGRGTVSWKVTPLACFLRDARLPESGLDLIVYTDSTRLYEETLASLLLPSQLQLLNIRYELGVSGAELKERLHAECDVNLGMGLSVLEGAAIGVPSVYVAPQTDAKNAAHWQWVYDRAQNDFGPGPFLGETNQPFDFGKLSYPEGTLVDHSHRSYSYAAQFHNISITAASLLGFSPRGTLDGYLSAHGKLYSLMAKLGQN